MAWQNDLSFRVPIFPTHRDNLTCYVAGVHMLFDGSQGTAWENEKRVNKLVFIGVNLNREQLDAALRKCLVE